MTPLGGYARGWMLLLLLVATLAPLCGLARAATPLRRPISPQQPMWLVHIDTWNYADPQKIIALIPADIRPFVVMNISLSISHDETTSQYQVAEYGYEVARSWLRACAENQMWAMVQPSSGGFSQFSDFDLSVYEEFYRDYPNFIGFNYCEQFWGYDSPTDPLSARWTDRINHFANLLKLSNRHGGYLVVSWCGNQWSPGINPIGMLKRIPAFAAACRDYTDNYILCEKHTQQSYQYDMESLALGAYLSGYSGQYGMRYDDTGWTDPTGVHENFTMATQGAPFLEHVMLTGQTVFDGPELIWTQCFREIGAAATTDGYTMRRWETFPQFDNVSVDLFRKVLDGTVRIPTRREVIDRTKIAVISDVNSGSADTIYSSPETLFEGLFRMDGDGNLRDNKTFFKKTGRYPITPTVFALDDADANSFAVKLNRSAYATRWPTLAAKVAEFDALFPQEYTGDIYAGRHENGWVIYNPYKTGQTASGSIPFKYNTCERMELTLSQYTAGVVKEYADRVTYYLSNYDNVLDTGLKTDVITIHGATTEPAWSFADRGDHQASVVTSSWADGVFTLTVQHNGAIDITVHCAGAATGRLTAYTPATIVTPARPSPYVGPLQYEAECFDYRAVGGVTRGGNTGAIRNYTGQGYLQFGNGATAAVRDTVTVLAPGAYRLETRYAVTGADITSVDLHVNGVKVATPTFVQTPTLSDWAVLSQTVTLQAGANTLEYRAASTRTNALYLDSIVVVPTAFTHGLIIRENDPGYVGGDESSVAWSLSFPAPATAAFTFRYAATEDRTADLFINGVKVAPAVPFPATGSPSTWGLVTVHAAVGAGMSEVRLHSVSAGGLPLIDFLGVGGAEETASRGPVADVYVRDGGSASTNFGTSPQLIAKHDPAVGSGFSRVSYLKFDVSGLADAQNVRLRLVPFQVDGAATLSCERLADDTWSETGMTWNNRPVAAGTLVATQTGHAVGQQIELDLTVAAKSEAAGDGVLSLRITNDGWNFIGFHSRESATEAFRPMLEYTRSTVAPGAVETVRLRFDESVGSTAHDSTGHGWNGTLINAPTWTSGGDAAVNAALRFSAGSHLTLPAGIVTGIDDFTLSFWLKPGVLADDARVFEFSDGTSQNSLSFAPRASGGMMRFALAVNGATQTLEAPSAAHFTTGVWTHVTVTLSGDSARLYLNGIEVASNPAMTHRPSDLGATTANFIGISASPGVPALDATVDEFRLHLGALSSAEVALMAAPLTTPANLAVTASGSRVTLSWTAVPGATRYTLRRATTGGEPYAVIDTSAGTSFTDTTVLNGTTYLYTVTAGNGFAESSVSAPVSALPGVVRTHLRFNNGAGATLTDSSGRGRHGAVVGSASWTSGGNARMGSALRLNGGHATLPAGIVADLADCTVAFWVKLDSIATWARIFDFNNGSTGSSMYFVPRTAGGVVRFGLNGQNLEAPAAVQFTTGVWTHVAITLSGNTATMYLNGAVVATSTTFANDPSGLGITPNNYLGKSASTADSNLFGTLDEFQLYEIALDASQIADLAALPLAPTALVATPNASQVALSWQALTGATSYTIKRSTTSGGPYATLATVAAATYADPAVTTGVTYYYVVSIADGIGQGATSAQVSALVPAPTFAQWITSAFPGQSADSVVGALADPDGDGHANLLEYYLGTSPTATSTAAPVQVELDEANTLSLLYTRAKNISGISARVQSSTDLTTWTDTGVTPIIVSDEGDHHVMRATVPLGSAQRLFLRLSVSTP